MTWLLLAAATVALAVWGLRRTATAGAYFVAARSAGPLLAGLGGTAAGLSAFVFVGGPGLFAGLGACSLWIILSAPITGALQCWAVGEPVVELAETHGCLTVPDLVAARFGEGWPRGLTALVVVVGSVATLAVQVKGLAILGEVLLQVPGWTVAVGALLATVTYTAAGGMRTGVLAEAAQGVVMATAAVGLAAVALVRAGGPVAAVQTIALKRPELLDPFGTVGPTAALGWFLLFGIGTCAQPHYLQKFLLLRDRASLRYLPVVLTVALLSVLTVWVGISLGATSLWLDGALELTQPDQLTAAFLRACREPGLVGLAIAAIVAAVMSTAATLLNLVAAAVTRDLPRSCGRKPPEGLLSARLATFAAGLAAAILGLASARPVALLGVLGWGLFTAGMLPVVLLGLNWSGATRRAAVAALAAGPLCQLGLELLRAGRSSLGSWEPGLTGAAVGMLVLVAVSTADRERR